MEEKTMEALKERQQMKLTIAYMDRIKDSLFPIKSPKMPTSHSYLPHTSFIRYSMDSLGPFHLYT